MMQGGSGRAGDPLTGPVLVIGAIRPVPWWLLRLIGLFNGVVPVFMEMRYLFDGSVILDGAELGRLLPAYRDTPVEGAERLNLESYRAGSSGSR